MIKQKKGGNWMPTTIGSIHCSYVASNARHSEGFNFANELDEWRSALTNGQLVEFITEGRRILNRKQRAALRIIDRNIGIYEVNSAKKAILCNLLKVELTTYTTPSEAQSLSQSSTFYPALIKQIDIIAKAANLPSPIHRVHAFDVEKLWFEHHFPNFIKKEFGTADDPIFQGFNSGALAQEELVLGYDKLKIEKFGGKKLDNGFCPNNEAALWYARLTAFMLIRTSFQEAIRQYSEEWLQEHFPGALQRYRSNTPGKEYLWGLRANEALQFNFFKFISEHALQLAKTGELTNQNISKWTIRNVIASHQKNMSTKHKEILEARERFQQFQKGGITKMKSIYQDSDIFIIEIDKTVDTLQAAMIFSLHTEFLQHCVGSSGFSGGRYKPMMNGRSITGDSILKTTGLGASYLRRVRNGETIIVCVHCARNNAPIATLEFNGRQGRYTLQQLAGYRNGHFAAQYRKNICNFLNALSTNSIDSRNSYEALQYPALAKHGIELDECSKKFSISE